MIKELIATLMISTGVAYSTPTFNNSETKPPLLQNTEDQANFTLQLTRQSTTSTAQTDPEFTSWTSRTIKDHYYGINSALQANMYIYNQTTFQYDSNNSQYFILTTGTAVEKKFNSLLYALQITPYNYLYDASTTVKIVICLKVASTAPSSSYNLNLDFTTLTSVERDWQNYLDMSNYGTPYNNYTVFNELTSTENGYLYNKYEDQQNLVINQNSGNQLITYEQDIEIVPNNTNLIYIMVQPYTPANVSRIYTVSTLNDPRWGYQDTNNYQPTISGTMIIPAESYEVIDIPGLCFEILTMPFAFVSQAFNLTIFPGTPYQINLSNLFLSIIGVLVFIFIIKLLVKNKFGG